MALLELQSITAGYDKNVILKDLDFQVEKGELVSLLGSSGCGKTTTLRRSEERRVGKECYS